MPGFQAFEHLSSLLALEIRADKPERIPRRAGSCSSATIRRGSPTASPSSSPEEPAAGHVCSLRTADAIRVNPRFVEMVIPVEWREEYKSKLKARETLQVTNRAIEAGKATCSSLRRIAYWAEGRLNERPGRAGGRLRAQIRPADPAGAYERAQFRPSVYWFAKW